MTDSNIAHIKNLLDGKCAEFTAGNVVPDIQAMASAYMEAAESVLLGAASDHMEHNGAWPEYVAVRMVHVDGIRYRFEAIAVDDIKQAADYGYRMVYHWREYMERHGMEE